MPVGLLAYIGHNAYKLSCHAHQRLLCANLEAKNIDRAFVVFKHMLKEAIPISVDTCEKLFHACFAAKNIDQTFVVFEHMLKEDILISIDACEELFHACFAAKDFTKAVSVFRELNYWNGGFIDITLAATICIDLFSACIEENQLENAKRVLQHISQYNQLENAKRAFPHIIIHHNQSFSPIKIDTAILNNFFSFSCKEENAPISHLVHLLNETLRSQPDFQPTAAVYNDLIHACLKARKTDQAIELFEQMRDSGHQVQLDSATLVQLGLGLEV